jgi:GTPase
MHKYRKLDRRHFLRASAMAAAGALLSACAKTPTHISTTDAAKPLAVTKPTARAESEVSVERLEMSERIQESPAESDGPFLMLIEDVFSIKGRGTVVTGREDGPDVFVHYSALQGDDETCHLACLCQ